MTEKLKKSTEQIKTLGKKLKAPVKEFIDLNWKKLVNINQYEIMGLDVGSSIVKAVQLKKDDQGYKVVAAGIAPINAGTEDGEYNEEANTIRAINRCLKSAGIKTKLAVSGVYGPEVVVRDFKFPSLMPEEIESAIMLEAAQVCPFNVDDSIVDYQLTPNGKDSTCGILVAATNSLVERKKRFIGSASLNNVLMDVEGLALLNCLEGCEKSETRRTKAVLNVGNSFTTLAIIGDSSLPFIRDIAYAGNDIVKKLADKNNVSVEAVRAALPGEGSADTDLNISASLAQACHQLVVDVNETLRYYSTQEKSDVVKEIFLCGGFAPVKGFVELLDEQLSPKVVLWNPLDKMRCNAGQECRDIIQKNGHALAVAAGFAMRSV
jgi:type IV pilus assembly protein PilM